jgi:hypothetical protein
VAEGGESDAARRALSAVPALVLLWAGIALVAYGAAFHGREVLVEEEIELPPELTSGPYGPPPGLEGLTATRQVPVREPEPHLIREITIGGLRRADDGALERTYSGEAPSACPT